jgi:hypothetical protein
LQKIKIEKNIFSIELHKFICSHKNHKKHAKKHENRRDLGGSNPVGNALFLREVKFDQKVKKRVFL